jgi:hypothetical protein
VLLLLLLLLWGAYGQPRLLWSRLQLILRLRLLLLLLHSSVGTGLACSWL